MLHHVGSVLALPYVHVGSIGGVIQGFGVIVAIGVLIGAWWLRRYAEWHGISDQHIRELTGWVTITGFLGAHWFDCIAYEWAATVEDPIRLVKIWQGISSYGGFIGGAMGWAFYVWWKRLPVRLFADTTIVGLLPAFSIGRIACTVVSDHVGSAVDPAKWYAALAMNYPLNEKDTPVPDVVRHIATDTPDVIHNSIVTAWNLGLIEFLYLVPVNLLILWLAFRPAREVDGKYRDRMNAGFLTVMTGVFYAPVRFFLDYLRPEDTDPRHAGLTFAQWASILAFGIAVYVMIRIIQNGKPAEPVTRTAGEAQQKLKSIGLKESEPDDKAEKADKDEKKSAKS
jgi:phosphatidylglycerol:prolipoprotein diacylglycerol transferase